MAIPVGAFFKQSGWANERLLEVCEGLSDEQLDATGVGVYGSIREMLLHLLSSEQYYLLRATGAEPAEPVLLDEWPGFDVLKRATRANGTALAAASESLPADSMVTGNETDTYVEMSATVLFVQAFNHSTEHRTQILSMLSALGVGPADFDSEIDGWSWGEASGEMTAKVG
ncbi:MAG: damage-inducible protein DinB [Dehalococcoidia bacterium]|jgi:uncharacterized damage-inducible protein DinB|nr:damage-inducible protein DinB [Dehalococcoidia bacterium]